MTNATRSAARTIALPSAAIPPGYSLRWPTKDPAGTSDYSLDISAWLDDAGDDIASATAVVAPYSGEATTLACGAVSFSAGIVTAWLSGGGPSSDHAVTITVTTTTGRVLELTVWVLVQAISPNAAGSSPGVIVGARGQRGAAGSRGQDIIVGSGEPTIATGRDGDGYIDQITGLVWRKTGLTWNNSGQSIADAALLRLAAQPTAPTPLPTDLIPLVRNSTVARLTFSELEAFATAAGDLLGAARPTAAALTGDEIAPVMQDSEKRRTTLMDAVRLVAARRAGLAFDSIAQAAAMVSVLSLPVGALITTSAYATAGDGGGGIYAKVSAQPSHAGKWQDSAGNWWELKNAVAKPENFGAKGDGSDDTAALAGFSAYVEICGAGDLRPSANYGATNFTLPNRVGGIRLGCLGRATITAIAGGEAKYLAGTKAYINNQTYTSNSVYCENITFDAGSLKERAVALTAYYCRFTNCRFAGGTVAGTDLTETTLNGATKAPSVVDNIFTGCMWNGNTGHGFKNDAGSTDFQIIGGHCFNNGGLGFSIAQSAGLNMVGVQVYGNTLGAASFSNFGFQTNVVANNFDGEVTIQTLSPSISSAVLAPNTFKDGNLVCNLGASNPTATLVVNAPRLQGSARILHTYSAASRKVIVVGGTSEAEGPFTWSNGSPNGIIIAHMHFNVAADGFLDGMMDIRGSSFVGGRAANVLESKKALAAGTSTQVTVEVDLSTEQLAGSDLEIDLRISTIENSFTNVRLCRARVYAGVARKQAGTTTGTYASVEVKGASAASGITVAAAWSVQSTTGPMTATLTITITHTTPNVGSVRSKVRAEHAYATAMRLT